MITNKEEQLSRYFEQGMTSAEEQNFLISVAASDEMRIAFRSQLELMKAVRSDKDSLRSVAQVRNRTLAALGLSATAATPFIEQELLRGSKEAVAPIAANLAGPRVFWFSHLLRTPKFALTAGLALGILSTTAVMRLTSSENGAQIAPSGVETQRIPEHAVKPQSNETIPVSNGLNNSGHSLRVAMHHGGHNSHVSASPTMQPFGNISADSNTIGVVTRSNAGLMQSQKPTINQTNDSTKAK